MKNGLSLCVGFFLLSYCSSIALGQGAAAASAASTSLAQVLAVKPIQPDVDIETPTTPDELEKCKLQHGGEGYILHDGNNRLLRVFLTRGAKNISQYSFYKNGIEVFRQFTDVKDSKKPNEFRWMNNAGSRWGIDEDGDQIIDRWKMISAEEVSAEAVAALSQGDAKRFLRLTPSTEELAALGLSKEAETKVGQKIAQMKQGFEAAAKKIALPRDSKWVQFSGGQPGIVPFGRNAAKTDLLVYENSIVLVRVGEGENSARQIILGTILKVGDNNWRLIGLPHLDDPDSQSVSFDFTFFPPGNMSELVESGSVANQGPAPTADMLELINKVQELQKNVQSAPANQRAGLHEEILILTLQIAEAAATPEEKDIWIRQATDNARGAVQTGEYPDGPKKLETLYGNVKKLDTPETAAYVKYWQVMSDYYSRLLAGEDPISVHAKWSENLTNFIEEFPTTESAAEGMMKLAEYHEMISQDNEALKWYRRVEKDFAEEPIGKKAAGAVMRMGSPGKAVPFSGQAANGSTIDIAQFKGNVVVLYFWDSWSDSESKNLKSLAEKFAKELKVVGVNLDKDVERMNKYLADNPMPFPQIHEPGGLDGAAAIYWGIQTPPMIILFDKEGKVVKQNLTSTADLLKALDAK